jgi:hypothetical protein
MTGLLLRKNKQYIFTDEHGFGDEIWAWDIDGDYDRGKRHIWKVFPKGTVIQFDIDNPPDTMPFIPILN